MKSWLVIALMEQKVDIKVKLRYQLNKRLLIK